MKKKYDMIGINVQKEMLEDFLERLEITQEFIDAQPKAKTRKMKLNTILEPLIDFFSGVLEDYEKYGMTITEDDIAKRGFLKMIDLGK